ncbi:MAG: hypothetical protein VB018_07785 [Lachnospiraceae bacterium]|nr:hypothetical protein [Lachnospiraceae bacterium]
MKKARPKTFTKTAYLCGFKRVKVAIAKKCYLSAGKLCKEKR